MCLTYYPVTFNDQLGRPMRTRRFVPTPGVGGGHATGSSASACGTGQQWLDFCAMVGHPEWTEDPSLFLDRDQPRRRRSTAWMAEHTVDGGPRPGLRLPHPARADRQRRHDHRRSTTSSRAGSFVAEPPGRRRQPGPPFRFGRPCSGPARPHRASASTRPGAVAWAERAAPPGAAELLPFERPAGARHDRVLGRPARQPRAGDARRRGDPPRVARPARRHPPARRRAGDRGAVLGARPDLRRAEHQQEEPDARPQRAEQGRDLLRRFVATCDVVVENYTPRCSTSSGSTSRPSAPSGPTSSWSGCPASGSTVRGATTPAFAFVIEDASGLTWLTGHPDQLPSRALLRGRLRTPGCTRCSACCSRSSTATAPARAASSKRRWSMPRSTSPPSRSSSTRPTARCSSGTGNRGPLRRAAEPVPASGPDAHGPR